MRIGVSLKINVSEIDKARLFPGKKGKYLWYTYTHNSILAVQSLTDWFLSPDFVRSVYSSVMCLCRASLSSNIDFQRHTLYHPENHCRTLTMTIHSLCTYRYSTLSFRWCSPKFQWRKKEIMVQHITIHSTSLVPRLDVANATPVNSALYFFGLDGVLPRSCPIFASYI